MNAQQARELALGLPGAVEKPHHELTSFRLPLFWGAKRCGVKLRLAAARPASVRELLAQAWHDLGGR